MDRQVIASGLLRDLWRTYDHGGHSMRSARSQLVETSWHFDQSLMEGVRREDFYEFLRNGEQLPALLDQPHVLSHGETEGTDLRIGNRLLMLAGVLREYEGFSFPPHPLVGRAAMYAGLPVGGGAYRAAIEGMPAYDLVTLLRRQDPRHAALLKEFGVDDSETPHS